jgi:hypothetical protein
MIEELWGFREERRVDDPPFLYNGVAYDTFGDMLKAHVTRYPGGRHDVVCDY